MDAIQKFYVYKWYNTDTNEVFYIGKGTRNRKNNLTHRNKIFQDYYANNNCANEIIKYFDDENQALQYEKEMISYYRSLGQAQANIDDGGNGGLAFIWTETMRNYKSQFNPMKDEKQKERMSKNNPMKNSIIAKKVAQKLQRAVIIDNQFFPSVKLAAEQLNTSSFVIETWCKRGYNTQGQPCRYADEPQKEYSDDIKQYGVNIKYAKAVFIDGKYYASVKLAAQSLGCKDSGPLVRALKANRKYKGHICSYANQQPSQEKNQ